MANRNSTEAAIFRNCILLELGWTANDQDCDNTTDWAEERIRSLRAALAAAERERDAARDELVAVYTATGLDAEDRCPPCVEGLLILERSAIRAQRIRAEQAESALAALQKRVKAVVVEALGAYPDAKDFDGGRVNYGTLKDLAAALDAEVAETSNKEKP